MRKLIKIGGIGTVITGNTPPRSNPELYGAFKPFIKATDMRKGEKHTYVTEEGYSEQGTEKYIKSLIPKGATCVVTIGSIGEKMTKAHCDCFVNQAINAVVPSKAFDEEYIYYLLKYNLNKVKALDSGTASGRENVSKSAFSNIEVEVVEDLKSQKKIGMILSAYDDLIENNQKQIKLLEEAAQRLYKEWFVDLRFPGHKDVEIVDGLPKGWVWKKLGEVCETYGGGTPSTKEPSYYDNGDLLWVTPTDITRNNSLVLLDTEKKITEEGLKNSSAKMVPEETILMTSRASVGYFGVCEKSVCTNQGFISCVPTQNYYQMYLLYNLMNRVEEIRLKAGGSTYLEISKKTFRDFEIALPDVEILMEFQKIEHKIFEETRSLAKKIVSLKEARDRLLPKLMSGEVEV